jgi:hypothetical protein
MRKRQRKKNTKKFCADFLRVTRWIIEELKKAKAERDAELENTVDIRLKIPPIIEHYRH